MTQSAHHQPVPDDQERAPLFGSWGRLYAAVLIYLAFWIMVFYFFTVGFDRPG